MTKHYSSGRALHEKILEGVNELADNVAATLGPRGRNVILHKKDAMPIVTKDGVTVAGFVEFEDPIKNTAAQIIKQVASNTNTLAGDGTTTSTVLTRAVLQEAQKYLIAGLPPVELKRGMDKAVEVLCECLTDMAVPVSSEEDIKHIATVSANGDRKIGELIAMAADQAGKDGAITVQDGKSIDTTLDLVEGFRFDSGYFSKSFVTDERRGLVKYDSPLVLVTDHKIDTVESILPVLELVARDSRPLVIVAEEVEGQALAAMIMNAVRGTLKVAAIKAPRYGQERRNILKDLCVSVGATFVSRESAMSLGDVELTHFGKCDRIEVSKSSTTIVGGKGDVDLVDERIESLKEEIRDTNDLTEGERIQERIVRLASGIAIIKVGGMTEVEMIERKHRIEDALEAVKAAQESGLVPGGGVALIRAAQEAREKITTDNEHQQIGAEIVLECIKSPLRQMAQNAGLSPDLIYNKVAAAEQNEGCDIASGEITNLVESGVVDPAKVTMTALQNAISAASTLITTNNAIVEC